MTFRVAFCFWLAFWCMESKDTMSFVLPRLRCVIQMKFGGGLHEVFEHRHYILERLSAVGRCRLLCAGLSVVYVLH